MNMLLVFKGHNGLHKKKITLVKYVAQIQRPWSIAEDGVCYLAPAKVTIVHFSGQPGVWLLGWGGGWGGHKHEGVYLVCVTITSPHL